MSSAEARKLDILLDLKKKGYNLIDGDKPEIMTMVLGGGYTLECNVKKPTKEWKIIFNDGAETTEYPADSEKIVHTYRGDADKLIKVYNDELRTLLEDGVRANPEPVETPVKQPEVNPIVDNKDDAWQNGGYQAKVIDAEYQVHGTSVRKPWRTIKGLTPRLAECGKVKIGKKGELVTSQKGTQFRKPEKIDHFLVTTMDKDEKENFIPDEIIMKKLGNSCREIPVRLPYDDPSLNFPTSYSWYESAACKCRGDGETAEVMATGEIINCDPTTCQHFKANKCKPNGILSVILDDAPRVGGVYKFRTVGWNSINNLFSSMEFIRGLTNGFLAGLPLLLTLTPKHTTIPGKGTPVTIYMVNLEYRGTLLDLAKTIKQTMDTRALMQYSVKDFEKLAEEALALPEAPEECKDIVEEFYPEAVKA